MQDAARDAGRDPTAIEITYNRGNKPDTVREYADKGVSRWVVAAWGEDLESCKRMLGRLSDTLVAPLG
jgi:hypothetical protein